MDARLSNEILGYERKYWDAMASNDIEAAVNLTKFPCVITSPRGARLVSEDQYRDLMGKMDGSEYKGIKLEDAHVELLSDDTAVVTYYTQVNGIKMLDSSTWVREGDNWLCGFHSENPIQ